jgi:parallel beta-helix repeat protein
MIKKLYKYIGIFILSFFVFVPYAISAGSVWEVSNITTEPNIVYFDKTRGTNAGSAVAVTEEFEWFWGSDVLYVWSPDGTDPSSYYTDPGVEIGQRNYAVDTNDKNYITFDGISFQMGNLTGNLSSDHGVFLASYQPVGISIENCDILYGAGNGIQTNGTSSDINIENCNIQHNGRVGIYFNNPVNTSMYITDSIISNNGWVVGGDNGSHSGITGWISSGEISGNTIQANGEGGSESVEHGIYLDSVPGSTVVVSNNEISGNTVGDGIKSRGDITIINNYIHDNYTGIELGGNDADDAVYTIIGNLITGSTDYCGIVEQIKGTGDITLIIENNTLYKNGQSSQAEVKISDDLLSLVEILLQRLSDPAYIVLIIVIILQQKQIMGFARITREVTQAITELSTLIKGMISGSRKND